MDPHIAIVDASIGDTPAERNLTREIDAETAVYKVSEGGNRCRGSAIEATTLSSPVAPRPLFMMTTIEFTR